jgi:hypothetical protein
MLRTLAPLGLALLVFAAACSDDTTTTDLGTAQDSGVLVDSGTDSGFVPDANPTDSGHDSGVVADTGEADGTIQDDADLPDAEPDDADLPDTTPRPDGATDGGEPVDADESDAELADVPQGDALPTMDGGGDGGTPGDGGSMCTIDGIYAVMFLGMTVYFQFDAMSGTWRAAMTRAELATPLLSGVFTFANGTFTIQEGPNSDCDPSDVGSFTLTFQMDCTFTLTLIGDPCTDRGDTLDGAVFTPSP